MAKNTNSIRVIKIEHEGNTYECGISRTAVFVNGQDCSRDFKLDCALRMLIGNIENAPKSSS